MNYSPPSVSSHYNPTQPNTTQLFGNQTLLKKTEAKKTVSSIFQGRLGQVIANINGVDLTLRTVEAISAERVAGGHEQVKATLISPDGKLHHVRIKAATANEAAIHHKIFDNQDPIQKYVPKMYGAYDREGNKISTTNLRDRSFSIEKPYIILEDVASKSGSEVSDFKFAKHEVLLRNPLEAEKHNHTKHSALASRLVFLIFKIFTRFAFGLSSPSRNGLFTGVVKIINFIKTKSVLKRHLLQLNQEELTKTINHLKGMKEALEQSRFAFTDSSLLFVLNKGENGPYLDIHLIDVNHGIHAQEGIANFDLVKISGVSALEDLIAFSTKLRK